ncbi:hypothetical protein ASG52_16900 [Methylobacterium sp. Leaf456]|uniref:hypothetical protein n=1 Tax=Methylobacterium sp. Leaf456 TaxID=1736382 RepID=UPI000700AB95|nr:hypothetical protein [Methylobacterium sp. Leaf456]KQT60923.1 hypothetical protein ASG52_16900 [Methylobacterium sp. Leaf456]
MRPTLRRPLAAALLAATILPGAALAQSVANPNDQPTAGTLPSGTSTLPRQDPAPDRPTGDVRAPSAIRSSTSVVPDGGKTRTNPLDHLSARYRSSLEN